MPRCGCSALHRVNPPPKKKKNALETSSLLLFNLFDINFMKATSCRSHLLSCSEPSTVEINGYSIKSNIKENIGINGSSYKQTVLGQFFTFDFPIYKKDTRKH